jgi:predicted nuclease of predicted toxin-antitoxin system
VDYQMLAAPDIEVLARAETEGRIVVSADTDFATLLALRVESGPSLILFRHPVHTPERQIERLLAELPALEEALAEGCIASVEESRVRVRSLPLPQ